MTSADRCELDVGTGLERRETRVVLRVAPLRRESIEAFADACRRRRAAQPAGDRDARGIARHGKPRRHQIGARTASLAFAPLPEREHSADEHDAGDDDSSRSHAPAWVDPQPREQRRHVRVTVGGRARECLAQHRRESIEPADSRLADVAECDRRRYRARSRPRERSLAEQDLPRSDRERELIGARVDAES